MCVNQSYTLYSIYRTPNMTIQQYTLFSAAPTTEHSYLPHTWQPKIPINLFRTSLGVPLPALLCSRSPALLLPASQVLKRPRVSVCRVSMHHIFLLPCFRRIAPTAEFRTLTDQKVMANARCSLLRRWWALLLLVGMAFSSAKRPR